MVQKTIHLAVSLYVTVYQIPDVSAASTHARCYLLLFI